MGQTRGKDKSGGLKWHSGRNGRKDQDGDTTDQKRRSVRDKPRQERETWESVAAMEDGRVIEVISMMRGGSKSKKKKNPSTSSGESEPENVGTESATEEEKLADGIEMERKKARQEMATRSREKKRPGGQVRVGDGVGGVGGGVEAGGEGELFSYSSFSS